MDKLPKQVIAEKEYVEIALNNQKVAIGRREKTVIELAAIATFLHNIYNGIENILKQILLIKNIEISSSATWHRDLLNYAVSTSVISEGLSNELYKYLTSNILVENEIIIELKTAKEFDEIHIAHCLNYLKGAGLKLCLLINFGKLRVEIKRIVNGL